MWLAIFILGLLSAAPAKGEEQVKRILVLQSGDFHHAWCTNQSLGLRSELLKSHEYQFHVEHLDLFRFKKDAYEKQLRQLLLSKYESLKHEIKGVFTCDDDALNFYNDHLDDVFHDIPVVFSGVYDPSRIRIRNITQERYSLVIERLYYRETISAALRIHPNTRRIVVIADPSPDAQSRVAELRKVESDYGVVFQYIGDKTFEETARQLESLGPGDILLRLRNYTDSAGRTMSFRQAVAFLRQHTKVPIYSFWKELLGEGIVGGYLISGYDHGQRAAQLLEDLIEGKPGANGRAIAGGASGHMFDYSQLVRFAVDPYELPNDSTVVNQPFNVYEAYKVQIWFVAISIVALAGLAMYLVLINRKLHMTRRDLLLAKNSAECASQTKSRFLANMSHELRTPLGVILGFADLLGSEDLSSEQRAKLISKIQRSGTAVSNILKDILDASSIEAGKLRTEINETFLRDILDDVFLALNQEASKKGISLSIRSEGQIPQVVMTDAARVRQILNNIVGNAVKFTESGAVRVSVCLSSKEQGGKNILRFDVSDTGQGLSESEAKSLFFPFAQADSSSTRKYGGTGLGLVLSRDLARSLGGDVRLEYCETNKGCVFSITLDVGKTKGSWKIDELSDLERSIQERSNKKKTDDKVQNLSGVRILLAEDAADNQAYISRFLTMAGARVDFADNGKVAVDKALQNDYDLVLMDIQMPVMDGLSATRKLREQGFSKPIVALTAHALQEERSQSIASGCDEHLTKPVDKFSLINTVARFAKF